MDDDEIKNLWQPIATFLIETFTSNDLVVKLKTGTQNNQSR